MGDNPFNLASKVSASPPNLRQSSLRLSAISACVCFAKGSFCFCLPFLGGFAICIVLSTQIGRSMDYQPHCTVGLAIEDLSKRLFFTSDFACRMGRGPSCAITLCPFLPLLVWVHLNGYGKDQLLKTCALALAKAFMTDQCLRKKVPPQTQPEHNFRLDPPPNRQS